MIVPALAAAFVLWCAPLGIWVQTTRRIPGVRDVALSDETAAAARAALRRSVALAAAITVLAAVAVLVLAHARPDAARTALIVTGVCGFHVAFWLGGAPLHRIRRRAFAAPVVAAGAGASGASGAPRAKTRVASLVPRDATTVLPRAWWAAPTALLVAPWIVILVRAAVAEPVAGVTLGIVAAATSAGALLVTCWGAWAHAVLSTPQDLSGAADPEALDVACRAFRRVLARGIGVMVVLSAVVTAAVAAVALGTEGDPETRNVWCAALGAIGGSVVGISGGVMGAIADRHRRVILEMGGAPPEPGVRAPAR